MPDERKLTKRCPLRGLWHLLASTPKEALLMEPPLNGWYMNRDPETGEVIPCRNNHRVPRSSAVPKGRRNGPCRDCQKKAKQRAKDRRRGKDPSRRAKLNEQSRAWGAEMRARGLLSDQAPRYRSPPWESAEQRKKLKMWMRDQRRKHPGWQGDHLIPVDHTRHSNLITGLHTRKNLKFKPKQRNREKGSHLPDPDTLQFPARRPWTLEDMRRQVRKGFAVWSQDVDSRVKPKERWDEPRVNWDLYELDTKTGDVIYAGDEPSEMAEAAE